jgi:hypothetical protein
MRRPPERVSSIFPELARIHHAEREGYSGEPIRAIL